MQGLLTKADRETDPLMTWPADRATKLHLFTKPEPKSNKLWFGILLDCKDENTGFRVFTFSSNASARRNRSRFTFQVFLHSGPENYAQYQVMHRKGQEVLSSQWAKRRF